MDIFVNAFSDKEFIEKVIPDQDYLLGAGNTGVILSAGYVEDFVANGELIANSKGDN